MYTNDTIGMAIHMHISTSFFGYECVVLWCNVAFCCSLLFLYIIKHGLNICPCFFLTAWLVRWGYVQTQKTEGTARSTLARRALGESAVPNSPPRALTNDVHWPVVKSARVINSLA